MTVKTDKDMIYCINSDISKNTDDDNNNVVYPMHANKND